MTHTPARKSTTNTGRIVAALVLSLGATVLGAAAQPAVRVEWSDQRLTVVADDTRLDTILREVAMRTGSRIVGLEHAGERVTVEIRNAYLLDAMRQLLEPSHVNYLYMPRASTASASDRLLVWLYGATAPRPGALREAIVVDAAEPADDAPVVSGYAPRSVDNEVTRLQREGAFDVKATQASLLSLTKASDPDVRILALQTLALQPTSATTDAIAAALSDDSLFVRGEAMVLLRNLGMGIDTRGLLAAYIDHQDPEVRGVAVMALAERPGEEAQRLIQRALGDDDASVRRLAAQALRQQQGSTGKR